MMIKQLVSLAIGSIQPKVMKNRPEMMQKGASSASIVIRHVVPSDERHRASVEAEH